MLRVTFAQRTLARSASTRENHAGQDVVGADLDQPPLHLDEPHTSGYPAIDVMNMLRVFFAQRMLARRAIRPTRSRSLGCYVGLTSFGLYGWCCAFHGRDLSEHHAIVGSEKGDFMAYI